MSKRLKHAKHNELACNSILNLKGEKFFDWVVTTAFYSCIHFVEHKLFPLQEVGKSFSTFNEYYNFSKSQNPKFGIDKHSFKSKLVRKYLTPISKDYEFLMNQCHTYRYSEYNVTEVMARLCVDKMNAIRDYCSNK